MYASFPVETQGNKHSVTFFWRKHTFFVGEKSSRFTPGRPPPWRSFSFKTECLYTSGQLRCYQGVKQQLPLCLLQTKGDSSLRGWETFHHISTPDHRKNDLPLHPCPEPSSKIRDTPTAFPVCGEHWPLCFCILGAEWKSSHPLLWEAFPCCSTPPFLLWTGSSEATAAAYAPSPGDHGLGKVQGAGKRVQLQAGTPVLLPLPERFLGVEMIQNRLFLEINACLYPWSTWMPA